ncbi:MAG TPA: hypothetical protein PLD40_08110 [Kiritimatiellia bacterium]|jgi:outer membrane biosynthesis protein TonB|nr:hypothetical protein [Kiritimatiellia bacterium]HOE37698.1 hypothetical protein [Kiritimatiellia bacterium]HOR75077.1 hypothetical protein [Kiritimatiellia bacterium]HOU59697.1 hypothetical protein [Kiritimatiellia bacterium]HPK70013.1 hypothetical protein [Kiritimatiellia bacterium]
MRDDDEFDPYRRFESGCDIHGDNYLRECSVCGAEFCFACFSQSALCADCAAQGEMEDDEEAADNASEPELALLDGFDDDEPPADAPSLPSPPPAKPAPPVKKPKGQAKPAAKAKPKAKAKPASKPARKAPPKTKTKPKAKAKPKATRKIAKPAKAKAKAKAKRAARRA